MVLDWKVRAALAFARQIEPGWRADALAGVFRALAGVARPRAAVAMRNLDIVFSGLSMPEKKKILCESYDNMIWTGVEMLAQQRDPAARLTWIKQTDGREHFEDAMRAGKGIIGLAGHIGNWELTASALADSAPITAIMRNSDNAFYCELIDVMRQGSGLKTLEKREPMMRGVSALRRGEILGIMPDQHGGREGIDVPFFGVPTSTLAGPAVFAYLTGAPIIPIQLLRLGPFNLKMIIDPPVEWKKLEDRETTIRDITVRVNQCLEKMIRRAPGQWLWQHRRFRELRYG